MMAARVLVGVLVGDSLAAAVICTALRTAGGRCTTRTGPAGVDQQWVGCWWCLLM
jgi:hypothetical protein